MQLVAGDEMQEIPTHQHDAVLLEQPYINVAD